MMKRSRLSRHTELARTTPLRRTGWRWVAKPRPARRIPRDTGPDDKTRALVLGRDHGQCVRCGAMETTWNPLQVHHRLPRKAGGRGPKGTAVVNSPSNLLTLCRACHEEAETERAWAYERGYLVREGAESWRVPVDHFYNGWVVAMPGGSWDNPPQGWRPGELVDRV
jgi:5-methylcytosine-specific restriction enzyme A